MLLIPAFLDFFLQDLVSSVIGSNLVLTRIGLLVTVSCLYTCLLPSWWAIIPLVISIFTMLYNPHANTPSAMSEVNHALSKSGFSIVARQESITGYVSVLDNVKEGYRVMRCDHSLLGGQWMYGEGTWPGGAKFKGKRAALSEPVYSIFVMLEAVRLVQEPVDAATAPAPELLNGMSPLPVEDERDRALVM